MEEWIWKRVWNVINRGAPTHLKLKLYQCYSDHNKSHMDRPGKDDYILSLTRPSQTYYGRRISARLKVKTPSHPVPGGTTSACAISPKLKRCAIVFLSRNVYNCPCFFRSYVINWCFLPGLERACALAIKSRHDRRSESQRWFSCSWYSQNCFFLFRSKRLGIKNENSEQ